MSAVRSLCILAACCVLTVSAHAQSWRALADSAGAQAARGDIARAFASLAECRDAVAEGPYAHDSLRADALRALARLEDDAGQSDSAIAHHEACLRLRIGVFGHAHPASIEARVSVLSSRSTAQQYAAALGDADSLLQAMRQSGDTLSSLWCWALGARGSLLRHVERLPEAEASLRAAVDAAARIGPTAWADACAAGCLLADTWIETGRSDEAEDFLRDLLRSDSLRAQGRDADRQFALYNRLGLLFLHHADPSRVPEAERWLRDAARLLEVQGAADSDDYAAVLGNLCQLYMRFGWNEEALRVLRQVAAFETAHGMTRTMQHAVTRNSIAVALQRLGRTGEALEHARFASDIAASIYGDEHEFTLALRGTLCMLLVEHGGNREADSLLRSCAAGELRRLDALFPLMNERDMGEYLQRLQGKIDSWISVLVDRAAARPDAAAELMDLRLATRGLLFRSARGVRAAIASSGDSTLQTDFQHWLRLREDLLRISAATLEERAAAGADAQRLAREADALERNLARRSAAFARGVGHDTTTWRTVRGRLGSRTAAVDIIRYRVWKNGWTGAAAYVALVLHARSGETPRIVHLGDARALDSVGAAWYRGNLRTSTDARSYNIFWAPLEAALDDADTVLLAPDGVYHQINPAALRLPRGGWLGDRCVVRFALQLGVVPSAFGPPRVRTAALVGAPDFYRTAASESPTEAPGERGGLSPPTPLPGAAREIHAVSAMLRKNEWTVDACTGACATEERIKNLHAPVLVHLATHGYFIAGSSPVADGRGAAVVFDSAALAAMPLLRSGLLLAGSGTTLRTGVAPDGADDGVLTAQEAAGLDLEGTRLVVLSACETGRGSVRAGEGVYGLQRAFRLAGARTVLMSLWTVADDVTAQFMERFYSVWLRDGDAHAAVAAAQRAVRRTHPDPWSWAPFVVAGD